MPGPAKTGRAGDPQARTIREAQRKAKAAIRKYGGLRPAARALGLNSGDLSHALHASRYPSHRVAKALGVKGARRAVVYACRRCGVIHDQRKTCRRARIDYTAWRVINAARIGAIVAWAESHAQGRAEES